MESACQREFLIRPILVVCLFFVAGVVSQDHSATCVIEPLGIQGRNISGKINLMQSGNITTVVGHLYGFTNQTTNKRGFHVHTSGNLSVNCDAAGPHYNPLNKTHGAPNDTERHVGDLGNIVVNANLESHISITDNIISLWGINSIVNRSIVVHSWEDDLGRGGNESSNSTGNSGYRIGCCTITLDSEVTSSTSPTAPTTTHQASAAAPVGSLTGILLICLAGLQLFKESKIQQCANQNDFF